MPKTITIKTATGTVRELPIQSGGKSELFYSNSSAEPRCIGHLRFDVDTCGKLWSSWWPHQAAQKHNRTPFRDEFDAVMNALQREIFTKPDRILQALIDRGVPVIPDSRCYGFHIDTDAYSYYVRVYPFPGDYSYSYCYVRGESNG